MRAVKYNYADPTTERGPQFYKDANNNVVDTVIADFFKKVNSSDTRDHVYYLVKQSDGSYNSYRDSTPDGIVNIDHTTPLLKGIILSTNPRDAYLSFIAKFELEDGTTVFEKLLYIDPLAPNGAWFEKLSGDFVNGYSLVEVETF